MKTLSLTIMLIISINNVKAQTHIHIEGQIDNFPQTDIIYMGTGQMLMPLKISENGKFKVDLSDQQIPSPITLNLISKRGKIEQQLPLIWLDNDTISINVNWSNKTFQTIGVSPYQSVSETLESLDGKKSIDFILKNPNYIPSLYFANREKNKIPVSDLIKIMSSVSDENKSSIYARRIENFIKAKKLKPVRVGDKLQDFSLPDKKGKSYPVLSTNNKPKLITLFSSGCPYSVASIELLSQLHHQNNDKFEIITIWEDASRATWLNSHKNKKDKITWINLWDEFGFATTYLNVEKLPTFYVVNEEGVLIDKFNNNRRTAKKLKRLFLE